MASIIVYGVNVMDDQDTFDFYSSENYEQGAFDQLVEMDVLSKLRS